MVDDFVRAASCPVNLSPVFLFLVALQAFEHEWSNLGDLFKVVGETMQGVGERAEIDVVLRNTDLARQKASQHSFRLARIKFVRALSAAQPVYDGITAGGHAGSHPEQHRALSAREAACLQTFPKGYRFFGSLESRARQIGNAVPPKMAEAIGRAIQEHAGTAQRPFLSASLRPSAEQVVPTPKGASSSG
jgi:C-5 cytosine-specific DNA methylase